MSAEEYYAVETELRRKELNRRYNVYEKPEQLRGWHLASCLLHKPGVYRIMLTYRHADGAVCVHGYVAQDVLRVAREQGFVSAPNGFTMP